MGRKPDFPKQIDKLNIEINRLKKCVSAEKKYHETEKQKWYTMLQQEKINAYKAGCQDTLRTIEDEETAYMKFMKKHNPNLNACTEIKLKTKTKFLSP